MAVYTKISLPEFEEFLKKYDIGGRADYEGIAGGITNTNYLVKTEGNRFILTLFERRINLDELPYYVGLMNHLAGKGVLCPRPVVAKDGSAIQDVAGKKAVLVTFLQGAETKEITPQLCHELGVSLAEFHLAGLDYKGRRENSFSLPGWKKMFSEIGPKFDADLKSEIGSVLKRLEEGFPLLRDLPKGSIHADLFPDNVFFLNGKVSGLIDFYFACYDYLIYDLAVCVNAWCFDAPLFSLNLEKRDALMSGYERVRPLSSAEKKSFPLFCMGGALNFFLTRSYDVFNPAKDAIVTPKNPDEYLRKIRYHAK